MNRSLLEQVRSALVVVAHPDDESFGLGAVLDRLAATGARTAVLCFTHGAASTLAAYTDLDRLGEVRAAELRAAASVLGVGRVELLDHPDGALPSVPLEVLVGEVLRLVSEIGPSHLLVFDSDGVTGHTDHARATEAALAAGRLSCLPVLGWTLPAAVARRLNAEFGTAFTGREHDGIDARIRVSRKRQRQAIALHRSQSADNPVLYRRLRLLGDREHLCLLQPPCPLGRGTPTGSSMIGRTSHRSARAPA